MSSIGDSKARVRTVCPECGAEVALLVSGGRMYTLEDSPAELADPHAFAFRIHSCRNKPQLSPDAVDVFLGFLARGDCAEAEALEHARAHGVSDRDFWKSLELALYAGHVKRHREGTDGPWRLTPDPSLVAPFPDDPGAGSRDA